MSNFAEVIDQDGSVSSLDAAAAWRLAEARLLDAQGRRIAAMYIYGYVAEIRLTASVLRISGFAPQNTVSLRDIDDLRADARRNHLMTTDPHDVAGWGRYLVHLRSFQSRRMGTELRFSVQQQAASLYDHWRPRIRYKALTPSAYQLEAVRNAAAWIDENYPRLWS